MQPLARMPVSENQDDCRSQQNSCSCTPSDKAPCEANICEEACCGPPQGPRSSSDERPGYAVCSFVESFIQTQAEPVPRIKTRLEKADILGAVRVRVGIGRNDYRIAPGLYCTGTPTPESPILVTANYKLSLDVLRRCLSGINAWILVLDTRGINVWCAAGKGNFSDREVSDKVKACGLEKLVSHRNLILPQLSATGVSARQVKKACGFQVIWGPIRAFDIPRFLKQDMQADKAMRTVTFTLWERLVLTPVEITLSRKPALRTLAVIFLLSGIGPGVFSIGSAWSRGIQGFWAMAAGIAAGAVITPIFLPWLPGKAFCIKGLVPGLMMGLITALIFGKSAGFMGGISLLLLTTAGSSYLAMNFTGATPFTSPSGVEKEMRKAIPFQIAGMILSAILWIISAFI